MAPRANVSYTSANLILIYLQIRQLLVGVLALLDDVLLVEDLDQAHVLLLEQCVDLGRRHRVVLPKHVDQHL